MDEAPQYQHFPGLVLSPDARLCRKRKADAARFAFEHKIQSLNYANIPQLRQSPGARYVYAMPDVWVWLFACVKRSPSSSMTILLQFRFR